MPYAEASTQEKPNANKDQPQIVVVAYGQAIRRGWADSLRQHGLEVDEVARPSDWDGVAQVVLLLEEAPFVPGAVMAIHSSNPHAAVVVLEPKPNEIDLIAYLQNGVAGLGRWDSPVEEVLTMIDAASQRRATLPLQLARHLAVLLPESPPIQLSAEEQALSRGILNGKTLRTLSQDLGYSEREVSRRLNALYRRMGVATRTDAIKRAVQWGLHEGA